MEVALKGENGRTLTLSDLSSTDPDDLRYRATLTTEAGRATVVVWDYRTWLARFLREVADAWEGFDGLKEYANLEQQLSLSCQHDGLGSVECTVTIGSPAFPDWFMRAVLIFGAGAHLGRMADEVEQFFGDAA